MSSAASIDSTELEEHHSSKINKLSSIPTSLPWTLHRRKHYGQARPSSSSNVLSDTMKETKRNAKHNRWVIHRNYFWIFYVSIFITISFLQLNHLRISKKDVWVRDNIHADWHPVTRSERFPSVDERVKFYMGSYYDPPCGEFIIYYEYDTNQMCQINITVSDNNGQHQQYPIVVAPRIKLHNSVGESLFQQDQVDLSFCSYDHDQPIVLWKDTLNMPIALWKDTLNIPAELPVVGLKRSYVRDAQRMLTLWTKNYTLNNLPPLIVTLGDDTTGLGRAFQSNVPYFMKARKLIKTEQIAETPKKGSLRNACSSMFDTRQGGILWDFNTERHWNVNHFVESRKDTMTWENKLNAAIWRGGLNGASISKHSENTIRQKGLNFTEFCNMSFRCQFALRYENSDIVDVGFAKYTDHGLTSYLINERPSLVKDKLSVKDQLKFKAIIIIEGNDVASGLKWVLYSRSVIMMPPPTMVSFAMESMLEPWVHYIPLQSDLSDVEEKILWMKDNDDAARKISERSTLFMHDFLFDEESAADNMAVKTEMMRRYQLFFRRVSN